MASLSLSSHGNKRRSTSSSYNDANDDDFHPSDDQLITKSKRARTSSTSMKSSTKATAAASSSNKTMASSTPRDGSGGKEAKKFFCDECGQGFTRKHGLQRHSTSHTGAKPHECDQCPKAFSLLSSLREHQRTHITSHPYECNECNKKFTDRSSLRRHARSHSGTLPFACPVQDCKRRFARKDALNAHSRTHRAESGSREEFACHICVRTLTSAAKLASHLLSHATAGRAAVAGASVSLADVASLTKDKDTKSLPASSSNSSEVDITLSSPSDDNAATACYDDVPHDDSGMMKPSVRHALVCSHVGCTKAFWSRVGLAQHLRVHNNEKPFQCGECDATFTSRSSLNQHGSVHGNSNGITHRCDWCGTCFDRRGNLERHTAAGVCAPSSSSSASFDSLLAVPLDFAGAADDIVAAIEGDESPLSMSSSSSPSSSQGNWSPASNDDYSAYSPEYDFISTSLPIVEAPSSSPSYSVGSADSADADMTPSWCSPDSVVSVLDGLDGDCSPAYSECDNSNDDNEYHPNGNVAQLLAVVPSMIGDALYDPSAPSSSLWGDLALETIELQALPSLSSLI